MWHAAYCCVISLKLQPKRLALCFFNFTLISLLLQSVFISDKIESGLGFQHCCVVPRLWWRELPAVVWALPWKNPPSRASPECPRVSFDMQALLLQRKPRSPSVRGRALTKKNPRRAACVEMLRAVERNCNPRYNYQLAVKRRWFMMRILGRLCWLSAKLLDFYTPLLDKRDHKSGVRL